MVELDEFKFSLVNSRKGAKLQPREYQVKLNFTIKNFKSFVGESPDIKIFQMKYLSFTRTQNVSKKQGELNHRKNSDLEVEVDTVEVNYNTYFMVWMKAFFNFDITINNYNFNTYKNYFLELVNVLEKQSKTGKIDCRKVDLNTIALAIEQYLVKSRKRSFGLLQSPKKKDYQRLYFKAERGLYEMMNVRSYILKKARLIIYDLRNQVSAIFGHFWRFSNFSTLEKFQVVSCAQLDSLYYFFDLNWLISVIFC